MNIRKTLIPPLLIENGFQFLRKSPSIFVKNCNKHRYSLIGPNIILPFLGSIFFDQKHKQHFNFMFLKGQTCSQFAASPNNKNSKTRVILGTHSFLFLIENDLVLQKKSYCCEKLHQTSVLVIPTQYNFTFFASIFFNQKQHKQHFNFTSLKGQRSNMLSIRNFTKRVMLETHQFLRKSLFYYRKKSQQISSQRLISSLEKVFSIIVKNRNKYQVLVNPT